MALLIASGTPPALAACTNPITAGFDNPAAATVANVCIQNRTVTGNVTNSGTISPSGIVFENGQLVGFINSAGGSNIAGGVSIDAMSSINAGTDNAFQFNGNSPGGGFSFTGGFLNNGTIAGAHGIFFTSAAALTTTVSGGVTNNGTINATGGNGIYVINISNYSGGITNTGTVTSSGNSAIRVAGGTNFAGGINNSGTLSGNIGISVATGAGRTFTGDITNTGNIAGTTSAITLASANAAITINQQAGSITGDIVLSALANVVNISGGTLAGDIVGAGANNTVNFNYGTGTFTYGSTFGFSTINQVNVNSGTIVLNGANSATNIAVNGGTLEVGDSANAGAQLTGTVNVAAGTLSGYGTIVGATTIGNGASLSPGGSIGTLTVNGSLVFNAGSNFAVEAAPSGANSRTNVTGAPGTVTINGGTVSVTPQLGSFAKTYTLINSTGAHTGTFSSISVTNNYAGTASLSYDANNVFLTLNGSRQIETPAGTAGNQRGVSTAINNAIAGGSALPDAFQALSSFSGTGLQDALGQLAGQNGAGGLSAGLEAGTSFMTVLLGPHGGSPAAGTGGIGLGYAAEREPSQAAAEAYTAVTPKDRRASAGFRPGWAIWGQVFGGNSKIDGSANAGTNDTTSRTIGIAAGADYRFAPDVMAGFALAGGGMSYGLSDGLGGGRSNFFQAGIYGTRQFGPAYLSGALTYAWHHMTTERTVTVSGTDTLEGDFNAYSLAGRVEIGYRFDASYAGVTPLAGLQVQRFHTPAYTETAKSGSAAFALSYQENDTTASRTILGVEFDKTLVLDGRRLIVLRSRAAWANDHTTGNASAAFQSLPGSTFTTNGAEAPTSRALFSAGAEVRLGNGISLDTKIETELASRFHSYAGTGTIRYIW